MAGGSSSPVILNQIKESKMSERQDLNTYMFKGEGIHTVFLTGTAVPTRTDIPKGTFCVIDYKDDASDHDIYIYGDATTAGTYTWILCHNETT